MTNFLRSKSTRFHEKCTTSSIAHHSMLQKNLTECQVYNYTVAMISVMMTSLRWIYNAIFCYYYFQFYREGDN